NIFSDFILVFWLLNLCVFGFQGCQDRDDEAPVDKGVNYVTEMNGQKILTLNAETQNKIGLVVAPFKEGDVPSSAVVWYQGKTWVYVAQSDHQTFVRKEAAGHFKDEKIVVQGAQILLSEESKGNTRA